MSRMTTSFGFSRKPVVDLAEGVAGGRGPELAVVVAEVQLALRRWCGAAKHVHDALRLGVGLLGDIGLDGGQPTLGFDIGPDGPMDLRAVVQVDQERPDALRELRDDAATLVRHQPA